MNAVYAIPQRGRSANAIAHVIQYAAKKTLCGVTVSPKLGLWRFRDVRGRAPKVAICPACESRHNGC